MTTKNQMLKMVRQYCSECMGGPRATANVWPVINPALIQSCTAKECIWFEYRNGKDPNPSKARVERGKKLADNLHSGKEQKSLEGVQN